MAVDRASDNPFPSILMVEGDPEDLASNPATGQRRLAVGTDHLLYLVDDSGVKHAVGDAAAHIADTSAAHAASSIAFTPNGSISATDVQAAIQEVRDEAGASGGIATDAFWAAAGDIAVATGNDAASVLSLGVKGTVPISTGSTLAYGRPSGVPNVIQQATNAASTTSLAVTIAAAASGQRLIVAVASNARDVNTPTCTNVTFTEVGNANFSTTMYVSVYVGVVAGGSSGTSVTITATGSNFIEADVYEVNDQLTPTGGTSATLTNTSAAAVVGTKIGDISPAAGTLVVVCVGEDNGTTSMIIEMSCPYRRNRYSAGTGLSAIAYAPGGPISAWITQGTTGGDFAAVIVPIT